MSELSEERKSVFRKRQEELLRILGALDVLSKSAEWNTLKELVYDKKVASIERQIISETTQKDIDLHKLYRLQGELAWAKNQSNIDRFADALKTELQEIKNQLS